MKAAIYFVAMAVCLLPWLAPATRSSYGLKAALAVVCLLAWLIPTTQILDHVWNFLKTGLYNKVPLFAEARASGLPVALLAPMGLAGIMREQSGDQRWWLSFVALTAIALVGSIATLYFIIYFDLLIAKIIGVPSPRVSIAIQVGAAILLIVAIYNIYSRVLFHKIEGKLLPRFLKFLITLSSIGLAQAVVCFVAPPIPLWGITELTCNGGPCR